MNPVVHFEMPYEDRDRASKFYSEAFGWKPQMMGPEMGNYVVMQTTQMDDKMMPLTPGQINGGMYKKTDSPTSAVPSVVIAVPDIYAVVEKVKASGGTILGSSQGVDKPDEIPGVGLYMSIKDSEGNRVGMLQPVQM